MGDRQILLLALPHGPHACGGRGWVSSSVTRAVALLVEGTG